MNAIPTQAELDQLLADFRAAKAPLVKLAEDAEAKREMILAEQAGKVSRGILGTALPEEVVSGLQYAKRVHGLIDYLPESEVPGVLKEIAHVLALVGTALGVQ